MKHYLPLWSEKCRVCDSRQRKLWRPDSLLFLRTMDRPRAENGNRKKEENLDDELWSPGRTRFENGTVLYFLMGLSCLSLNYDDIIKIFELLSRPSQSTTGSSSLTSCLGPRSAPLSTTGDRCPEAAQKETEVFTLSRKLFSFHSLEKVICSSSSGWSRSSSSCEKASSRIRDHFSKLCCWALGLMMGISQPWLTKYGSGVLRSG